MIAHIIAIAFVALPRDGSAGIANHTGYSVVQAADKNQKQQKAPKTPKKKKAPKAPPPDQIADDDPEADQIAPPPVPPIAPGRFEWQQHPTLRFGDVRLEFEAKLQEDGHASYPDAALVDGLQSWEFHRNRIGVQGSIGKHIDFEVERELTEKELTESDIEAGLTPKSQWKDVRVNFDYLKNAQIQAGRFKIPFGLDETIGVSHNDFVYRSLGANYLAPSRDVGLMVHGRFFRRGLNYWAGGFAHDGDNARSKKIQGGDATVAGRVTIRPLRRVSSALDFLELGTSLAATSLSDDNFRPNGLRGRTVVTQRTFYEPVYVKGTRWRMGGDVDWLIGPASARAEYTEVRDTRLKQGLDGADLPDARYRSWYVMGTWIVTGEQKTRPVVPANDLFAGGFGAVELVGRYERMYFDSVGAAGVAYANPRSETILPAGDRVLTIGVNWSLNRFVKIQVNGMRERVEHLYRNPISDGTAFWSRVLRLQLVL